MIQSALETEVPRAVSDSQAMESLTVDKEEILIAEEIQPLPPPLPHSERQSRVIYCFILGLHSECKLAIAFSYNPVSHSWLLRPGGILCFYRFLGRNP